MTLQPFESKPDNQGCRLFLDPSPEGASISLGIDLYSDPTMIDVETAVAVRDWLVDWLESVPIKVGDCLLYTSPSPRDRTRSRMPSSA